jgi:hypothetical protein
LLSLSRTATAVNNPDHAKKPIRAIREPLSHGLDVVSQHSHPLGSGLSCGTQPHGGFVKADMLDCRYRAEHAIAACSRELAKTRSWNTGTS